MAPAGKANYTIRREEAAETDSLSRKVENNDGVEEQRKTAAVRRVKR